MTTPAFRYAERADAQALVDLIERAYRGPETAGSWTSEAHLLTGPRTNLAEISDLIARSDSRFIIAEQDGRIAGCCLVQGLGRDLTSESTYDQTFAVPNYQSKRPKAQNAKGVNAAYFGMFAIDPATAGAGLGKAVIAEAERRVRDLWDCNQMVMTVINVRTQLIEWYQRRGYRLTGARLPFPFSETTGETTRDFHLSEMRKDLA